MSNTESKSVSPISFQQALWRCMKSPDNYVMEIDYLDVDGNLTRRTISPTKYGSQKKTLFALCLSRENARQFYIDRIQSFRLLDANTVLMPVEIINLNPEI